MYSNGLTNYCFFSNVADGTKTQHFNAEIVGFNVQGKTTNLDPPVEIEYGLYDVSRLHIEVIRNAVKCSTKHPLFVCFSYWLSVINKPVKC